MVDQYEVHSYIYSSLMGLLWEEKKLAFKCGTKSQKHKIEREYNKKWYQ